MDYPDLKNTESLTYTDDVMKSFKTVEILKSHSEEINSIAFSDDGLFMVTSGNDDVLCFYEINKRDLKKKLFNRKFGCENAVFIHNSKAILCSSKTDFRIMYWNLHNNEILYSFLGHSDKITDININPLNDLFLTSSSDNTSRLWDLTKRECICIFQDSNHAVFDNTGKVIASVTFETDKNTDKITNYINLYAVDTVTKGPFKVFKIDFDANIRQLKFTNDGKLLIAVTDENSILVIESYEGHIMYTIQGDISEKDDNLYKVDISPDSKYLISGSENGTIYIWSLQDSTESNHLICSLECHNNNSNCVKFNPKLSTFASSCSVLALWQPSQLNF